MLPKFSGLRIASPTDVRKVAVAEKELSHSLPKVSAKETKYISLEPKLPPRRLRRILPAALVAVGNRCYLVSPRRVSLPVGEEVTSAAGMR